MDKLASETRPASSIEKKWRRQSLQGGVCDACQHVTMSLFFMSQLACVCMCDVPCRLVVVVLFSLTVVLLCRLSVCCVACGITL